MGKTHAVNNVSISIGEGEIFAGKGQATAEETVGGL
jgi:hypothetical protein